MDLIRPNRAGRAQRRLERDRQDERAGEERQAKIEQMRQVGDQITAWITACARWKKPCSAWWR
jgi:hypothetical protein